VLAVLLVLAGWLPVGALVGIAVAELFRVAVAAAPPRRRRSPPSGRKPEPEDT
jgi:hypothetical protein